MTSNNLPPRPVIMTNMNPTVTRIFAELGCEIGLNESIVLAQLAFWIENSSGDVYHDGHWWTYQSLSEMKEKAFPYWHTSTISRNINKLVEDGYVIKGNYNKREGDQTQWFALNLDKLSTLESIKIVVGGELFKPVAICNEVLQDATAISPQGIAERNSLLQDATTLPQTPTQTPLYKDKTTVLPISSENAKPQNPVFYGFVPNGSGSVTDSSPEREQPSDELSRLEEIIRSHGIARLTKTDRKKLRKPQIATHPNGVAYEKPSPHDYIEQGNEAFVLFVAYAVKKVTARVNSKYPNKTIFMQFMDNYHRKDGWMKFERDHENIIGREARHDELHGDSGQYIEF